jgi:hypothetical protein
MPPPSDLRMASPPAPPQAAQGEHGAPCFPDPEAQAAVDAELNGELERHRSVAEGSRHPHDLRPVARRGGVEGGTAKEQGLGVFRSQGPVGAAGGYESWAGHQYLVAVEGSRGGIRLIHVAQPTGHRPADAVSVRERRRGRPILVVEVEADQESAAGGHEIPPSKDRAAGTKGAEEKDRARDPMDLFRDVGDEQGGGVIDGGGGRAAGGETDVGGQVPAHQLVGFDYQAPGKGTQMGRARGVTFQHGGGVDGAPEVGGFRLLLAGPDLDHGLQQANRDRHPPMLEPRACVVKEEEFRISDFGFRIFRPPFPRLSEISDFSRAGVGADVSPVGGLCGNSKLKTQNSKLVASWC